MKIVFFNFVNITVGKAIQQSVFVVKLFQFAWDENSLQRIFLLQISHPFLQHFYARVRGQVLLQIYATQTMLDIFSHGKVKANTYLKLSLSMSDHNAQLGPNAQALAKSYTLCNIPVHPY